MGWKRRSSSALLKRVAQTWRNTFYMRVVVKASSHVLRRQYADFENARSDNDSGKAEHEPTGAFIQIHHKTDDCLCFKLDLY